MPKHLLVVWLAVAGASAAAEDSREIHRTFPLNPDGRVVIEAQRGSIMIDGWDSVQVEVRVRIEAGNLFFPDPESVREADVRFDSTPHALRIENDYSKIQHGFFFQSTPRFHYRIQMPRTASLRIQSSRVDTEVRDLRSDVAIESSRGNVTVRRLDGSIALKISRGDAEIAMVQFSRRSEIEAYRGDVRLNLPRDRGFYVDTDVDRHSRIDSDFSLPVDRASRRDKEYRGAVNGGGPNLKLRAQRGTIRLRRS